MGNMSRRSFSSLAYPICNSLDRQEEASHSIGHEQEVFEFCQPKISLQVGTNCCSTVERPLISARFPILVTA